MVVLVHKSQRGTSLMEVLVSIVIISVVMTALLYGILMSFKASQMAQTNVTAEGLASSALEDVRGMAYRTDHVYTLPSAYATNYPNYSIAVTAAKITQIPDTSPYTETVTVTVTYIPSEISTVDLEHGGVSFSAPNKQVITVTTYMTKDVAP